jgi:hypothetical protein
MLTKLETFSSAVQAAQELIDKNGALAAVSVGNENGSTCHDTGMVSNRFWGSCLSA